MIKTLDELKQLKKQQEETIRLREADQRAKIIIGMGTCGIAAGAREVLSAILDELGKRRITDVVVTQTGCIGLCIKEPLVEVLIPGKAKVTYANIDAGKARQIIAQHIINGIIVNEWVVNRGEA